MKKTVLSLLSLLTAATMAQAQEVNQTFTFSTGGGMTAYTPVKYKIIGKATTEFTYDYQHLRDTADAKSVVKDLMTLQIGEGISKFCSYKNLLIDSLLTSVDQKEVAAHVGRYIGGEPFSVFKNFPAGKCTFIDKISTDWFKFEEEPFVQDWKLTEGDTTILGYSCQRAECDFRGRHYTAWYTSEIPMPNGPWKLGGLPGLIMKASDNGNQYSFMLVGMTTKSTRDITIPDVKFYNTDRKAYYKGKFKCDSDPIGYLRDVSGINMKVTNPDGTPNEEAMKPHSLSFDYLERDWKK